MLTSRVHYRLPYTTTLALELAAAYVADAPELVWKRSESEALAAIRRSVVENNRYEVSVWDGDKIVGVAIAVPDDDDHVGVCLSVQWRFVLPEYRGLAGVKLQRAIMHLARRLQFGIIAYTKRTGDAKYELRYIRVRNPHGQES